MFGPLLVDGMVVSLMVDARTQPLSCPCSDPLKCSLDTPGLPVVVANGQTLMWIEPLHSWPMTQRGCTKLKRGSFRHCCVSSLVVQFSLLSHGLVQAAFQTSSHRKVTADPESINILPGRPSTTPSTISAELLVTALERSPVVLAVSCRQQPNTPTSVVVHGMQAILLQC